MYEENRALGGYWKEMSHHKNPLLSQHQRLIREYELREIEIDIDIEIEQLEQMGEE